ncbi:DUF1833 domain-containing protein [Geomonas nitrogeniifigens]|uniref:DUF1833 family protein n=1 Tax=Geomonas diazotrophica TaxID=2843197 RepID=UPI001C2BC50A|nr:DUF1833 family protein [Geomonas nitrogeniifigens]QXE85965.1 DUF1833 domain-containing protein [Geomonas nitrogeniifigens]
MSILETVYASGGDVIIETLELSCPAWDAPILLCNGFEDHTCTDENGRSLTFTASGITVSLPKKDNSGDQSLAFAIDNVTGEAQARIDAAIESGERVALTYRPFLASDKSTPADPPYRMTVLSGSTQGAMLQIQAGFFDMLNTAWPRDKYTTNFAPGLKYL